MSRPMTARQWTMLLTLAALWGGSFLFNAVAVQALPVMTIVAARVGLAALVLLATLPLLGIALPRGAIVWRAFAVMGLLNNAVPFTLIVWGQGHIPSGLASILNATTPLFAVLLAHWLTADERLTASRLAGVLLGLGGVAVLVGPVALAGFGTGGLAELACIGAALSYAFAGIYGRRFRAMGVAPLAVATGQVTASSVLLVPLALAVDRPWALPLPGAAPLLAVLALALLATALAYWLYFRLLASAGATNLLLVTLLVPPVAVALGALVLGEVPTARHGAGLALIAAGLATIDGRVLRAVTPSRRASPDRPR
jgi:drug/metabolite transporter (DMT)-like permease